MASKGQLDHDLARQLASLVEKLTTTGALTLDVQQMKEFKKICKMSDVYVERAYHLLMTQLSRQHAEIRLSTFQVIDELFNRSHAFRELLVTDFQTFLELTVETDQHHQPLPPPKAAANRLKADTLKAVQKWQDKYGSAYKKLALGYRFLKTCKYVNFNDIRARTLAEQRRLEQQEQRKQKALAAKLEKARKEFSELHKEITDTATEAENCIELLLPKPDLLFTASDFEPADTPGSHGNTNHITNASHDLASSSSHCRTDVMEHCHDSAVSDQNFNNSVSRENTHTLSSITDTSSVTLKPIDDSDRPVCDVNRQETVSEKTDSAPNTFYPCPNGESQSDESDDDDDEEDFEDVEEEGMVQAHGLGSRKYKLQIEIGMDEVRLRETEDNRDLVNSLRDSSCLVTLRFLPSILRWLEVLSKTGGSEGEIKALIDLKQRLENIKAKCAELRMVPDPDPDTAQQPSDSEEEMEEVPEKEGYEPVIPPHLRAEYGLDPIPPPSQPSASARGKSTAIPGRSGPDRKKTSEQAKEPSGSGLKQTSNFWNLPERNQAASVQDPTSRAASIAKLGLKDDARPSTSKEGQSPGRSQSGHDIPVLPYGMDLDYWGTPDKIEAPMVLKNDSLHRFWMPVEVENEKPSQNDIAAVMNRTFHYTGEFVPVKWKCRAKLPSGKLCERMDREKCPFHGKIIPRDKDGLPSNPEDLKKEREDLAVPVKEEPTEGETQEIPPWLDAELQEEIEAATGHDLGSQRSRAKDNKESKGKGKGKGKKTKHEGLTNIKESKNTTRARLESKVFSKRALKRVASALDAADYKRVRDKFGNQFNYAIKK